jgi:hypothetical protein
LPRRTFDVVPAGLEELATLGRTLHRRRADVLAYFTHRASNGPTEAINGRLEALRRNALGFRNLINYRIRALPHSGHLALQIRKSRQAADSLFPQVNATVRPYWGAAGRVHASTALNVL